jgi:hypothetical protein
VNLNIHKASESGANLAPLATGADVEGVSGVYFEGGHEIKGSVDSYDVAKQEELWEWTVKNISVSDEERMLGFD